MVARAAVLVLLLPFSVVVAAEAPVLIPVRADGGFLHFVEVPAPFGAPGDTVVVYGGTGTLDGKFEDAAGAPTFGDWTPVDRTVRPGGWQRSTFGAENLGGHGAGNHAMWAGVDDPTFVDGHGYGNDWDAILLHESGPVSGTGFGQTVALDFVFNLDAADANDRFVVEYETSSGWQRVLDVAAQDHSSLSSFAAPGARFSEWQTAPIRYESNTYADGDRIRIRLRFRADASGSDEDGLGAGRGPVQVDDVVLTTRDGTFTEDFEGDGPHLFASHRQWFGDFSDVYVALGDEDSMHDNTSGVVAFVDRGQDARNPLPDGTATTGGAQGTLWTYGPDGAVVLPIGGLSGEDVLWTEIWSPPIDLALAPPSESDPSWTGFWFEADVYTHVTTSLAPLRFAIGVRARDHDGAWTPWVTALGLVNGPRWFRARTPFDLFVPGFTANGYRTAQFALGAYGLYPPSSEDHLTPAPYFDNVRVLRSRASDLTSAPSVGRGLALDVSPNPFNPRTTIRVRLDARTDVDLAVHDLRGSRIRTLFVGSLPSGDHTFAWNGNDDREQSVASGVYLVRAISVGTETTRKIALVR